VTASSLLHRFIGPALLFFPGLAGVGLAAAPTVRLPTAKDLAVLFKSPRIEQVTLAPDGRHLAHTLRTGTVLSLVTIDVDQPEAKATITIGEDQTAGLWQRRTVISARVTYLRWVTSDRLVYALTVASAGQRPTRDEVRTVDANGKNDRKLVDADDLAEMWSPPMPSEAPPVLIPRRPRVFAPRLDEPDFIQVEALGGRNRHSELFQVDLRNGKFVSLSAETMEGRFLYDRQGRARVMETPWMRMPERMGGRGAGGGGMRMPPPEPMIIPQAFEYCPATGSRRWSELDKLLGPGLALRFRVSADTHYGERSFPLTFDRDPNVLYFASNVGRDTYGLYALNLTTRQRTAFAFESPEFDAVETTDALSEGPLIFDRAQQLVGLRRGGPRGGTQWLDAGLARWQQSFDAVFAGRHVEILDWADDRRRALLLVSSESDAGRYFIHEEGNPGRWLEFFRRAPGMPTEAEGTATPFVFDTPAGVRLRGVLTLPRQSRTTPPPLVVYCRDLPGRRTRPGVNREVQALSGMGFAVAQLDYRGVAGLGARHRDAAKAGFDRIPIEDVRATVAWLAAQQRINPKRVAMVGQGFGGFIALRAVQLHPKEFRCAVSINAPTDPARWVREAPISGARTFPSMDLEVRRAFFDGNHSQLAAIAVTRQLETLVNPVFIIQDADKRDLWESQGTRLRDALARRGAQSEYLEVANDFTRGEPEARARVFARIGEFLNEHIYDYGVNVGEAKEVK
jgi:pimeloyl-ACP methyl ester carboxylesterase